MTNPAVIAVPKNVWTKVADGVTNGFISLLKPSAYIQTFRDAGDTAPIDSFRDDAAAVTEWFLEIESDILIDVYMMGITDDGSVRVDL